jgi:hypothetical protein
MNYTPVGGDGTVEITYSYSLIITPNKKKVSGGTVQTETFIYHTGIKGTVSDGVFQSKNYVKPDATNAPKN